MASIHSQALELILRNYADVIEGGSAYRGSGTSWRGIPGRYSNDAEARAFSGGEFLYYQDTGGTTTQVQIKVNAGQPAVQPGSWPESRWVKTDTPGWFVVGVSGTAANIGAARRITAWNDTYKEFTCDALPAAVADDDSFNIREGFKRVPNQEDPDRLGGNAFDRGFWLRALPGKQMDWTGGGTSTYETHLELKLRLVKYGRMHDAAEAALANLAIIREVLPMAGQYGNPDHRDGTYTRALSPPEDEPSIVEDAEKVVVTDRYPLIYRVNSAFL